MDGSSVDPLPGMASGSAARAIFRWSKIFDTNGPVKLYPSYKQEEEIDLIWISSQSAFVSSEKIIPCGIHSGRFIVAGKEYPIEDFEVKRFTFEIDVYVREDAIEDEEEATVKTTITEEKTETVEKTVNKDDKMNEPEHYISKYKDLSRNQVTENKSYTSPDGRNKTDYTKTYQTYQSPSGEVKERTVEERTVYSHSNNDQSNQPQPAFQPPQQRPRQRNLFKLLYGNQVGHYEKYNLDDRESQRVEPKVIKRSSPVGESPLEVIHKDINIDISMGNRRQDFDQTDGVNEPSARNSETTSNASDAEVGHLTDIQKTQTIRVVKDLPLYRSPLLNNRTSPLTSQSRSVIKVNSYTQTPHDNRFSEEERRRLEESLAHQRRLQADRDKDNHELQRQIAELREQLRSLKEQNDRLMISQTTTTTTTVEERRRLEDNMSHLRKQLQERENELRELQRQLSALKEVNHTLKDENNRLVSTHTSKTTTIVEERNRLDGIVAQLRKQLAEREDNNNELQRQMSGLRDVNRTLKDENDRLMSSHMSTTTTSMEERKRLLENVTELRRLLAEREDEIRELQRQLSNLQNSYRELKEEKEYLVHTHSSTSASSQEERRRFESTIAELRKQLSERDEENRELHREMSSLREQNRTLKDEIDRLRSSQMTVSTSAMEERKRLEDNLSHLRKLLSDRESDTRDLRSQISSLKDANRALKDELTELKNTHVSNSIIAEYERKIAQIQSEKDIMTSKVTRLNDEIQFLRSKNTRHEEDYPNINDLLKKIASLESENLILTQANEVARAELGRRDREITGLCDDKYQHNSHNSRLLQDDRDRYYKYKTNSSSYTSSPSYQVPGETYKTRYTDKQHHNGYSKTVDESINKTPTNYSRTRREYEEDSSVPTSNVQADWSRKTYQPSQNYCDEMLSDLNLHDRRDDSKLYKTTEGVNSHVNSDFFPELTKYSNFNAGDLISARYHRRLESDKTRVFSRPRSADGRTYYDYGTDETRQKYRDDYEDMSDTPTDVLLGSSPVEKMMSHSKSRYSRKETNNIPTDVISGNTSIEKLMSRSRSRYARKEQFSDSSQSDLDEGYQSKYRKRSRSVMGRGRFDDALYIHDPNETESVHYHVTQVQPTTTMEGLAPVNQKVERAPSPVGYRSIVPKPLLTQHNKHLYTSSQSNNTVAFSNSIFQGLRPYSPSNPSDIKTNDIVKFSRQGGKLSIGFVRFIGNLPGRTGVFLGVELHNEAGKHDGIFDDVRYFKCKPNKGVFVSFNKVVLAWTSF